VATVRTWLRSDVGTRPCVCARRPDAEAPIDGKLSRLRPDNACSHSFLTFAPYPEPLLYRVERATVR